MNKAIKFLAISVTIVFLSSFIEINKNEIFGTYGVSNSDPSQIKLTINSDNTFYYQDFSMPENKIAESGNWSIKGKRVYLKSNKSNVKFHNVWTISENGQVAKSNRGLTFYRLCKINE
jgi:hypothetical protein